MPAIEEGAEVLICNHFGATYIPVYVTFLIGEDSKLVVSDTNTLLFECDKVLLFTPSGLQSSHTMSLYAIMNPKTNHFMKHKTCTLIGEATSMRTRITHFSPTIS